MESISCWLVYDYPSLTHAFLAQFFRHCLKVQHQFGIITNVLANLIHKENHMVVVTFFLNIGLYTLGEILNADLVASVAFSHQLRAADSLMKSMSERTSTTES